MAERPFQPAGTVYGTLMNFASEHAALAAQMNEPPYKAPPRAPVLYVKPANTWSAPGAEIALPVDASEVALGASLAMVLGPRGEVAGYVLVNDLTLPHTSFYRPPVKLNCLDGFLGIAAHMAPAAALDVANLSVEVLVNGELRQRVAFDALVRSPARLLADVAEFMTLAAGDLLMLGCEFERPRAGAGDVVELRAPGLGSLRNTLVREAA